MSTYLRTPSQRRNEIMEELSSEKNQFNASDLSQPRDEIYQFSLLSALVSNVYSKSVGRRMSTLRPFGDFGLGTFTNLDGEMVMLDGIAYHLAYDGSIKIVESDALLPFATLTKWPKHPMLCKMIGGEQREGEVDAAEDMFDRSTVQGWIETEVASQSKNDFLAIKITGQFGYIQMRTAKAVTTGQSWRDVPSTQRVEEIQGPGIQGTMLGFRAPQWAQGITVGGYHLHFIDKRKEKGGHVLDYKVMRVKMEVEVIKSFKIDLPVSKDFENAEIKFNLQDIFSVEGK